MLKSLLSLLLSKFYSKKESGEVAHQALPAEDYTTLLSNKSASEWSTVGTGTAAYDGYLRLDSVADGSTTASILVKTPSITSIVQYPFDTAGVTTWVPIAKGKTWEIQGSESTSISLRLYKTIGGGIKLLRNLFCKEVAYA